VHNPTPVGAPPRPPPDEFDLADLPTEERVAIFRSFDRDTCEERFSELSHSDQVKVLRKSNDTERRWLLRSLQPDDTADVLQQVDLDEQQAWLKLLDDIHRREIMALLVFAEDAAGGLMNPRFSTLRAEMGVDEALLYLRRRAREQRETTYYVYVLDTSQRLVGVVSLRSLLAAPPGSAVADVMATDVVSVPADMDQEAVSRLFTKHDYLALPVVDGDGHMQGIVTADDIVHVVNAEATEDIQKMGGMEALEDPYLEAAFFDMVRKRAGWLSVLAIGEMLTATAMAFFQDEIQRVVVLATFVPLIISSGGNSGSQASTLVIRAIALGEVGFRDIFQVARREIMAGFCLGMVLAVIGFLRIWAWELAFHSYGALTMPVSLSVGTSLLGVVMFGTLCGSMLPFLLKKLGADPASASAPFVATLVDVSGLLIYFTVASMLVL
jgi:magnesium transporter